MAPEYRPTPECRDLRRDNTLAIADAAREYVRAVTDPALRQVTWDTLRAWSVANARKIAARQSLIAAVDAEGQS